MKIKNIEVNIFRMNNGEWAGVSEVGSPKFFLTASTKEDVVERAKNAIDYYYNSNVKNLPEPKKGKRILRDNTRFAFLAPEEGR